MRTSNLSRFTVFALAFILASGLRAHCQSVTVINGSGTTAINYNGWTAQPVSFYVGCWGLVTGDLSQGASVTLGGSYGNGYNLYAYVQGNPFYQEFSSCDELTVVNPEIVLTIPHLIEPTPGPPGDENDAGEQPPGTCSNAGMPQWSVSQPYVSLWLHDEPLGYQPALGPRISLALSYKQREYTTGFSQNFFSMGRKWNFPWFSFIGLDSSANKVVHFGGGLTRTFYGTNDYLTNARLSGDTTNGFIVYYPDGRQNAYTQVVTNSSGKFLWAFLTEMRDVQSNKTSLYYAPYSPSVAPTVRLNCVVDGDGKTNTIYYTSTAFSGNLISQVVDPFNRTNSFAYDNVGQLTNLTDVAGISTSFGYDGHGFVTSMTTPYGTNSFSITDPSATPNGRAVLVTEADGGQQLYLYKDSATGVPSTYSQVPTTSPFSSTFDTLDLDLRNTFHWGRLQYAALSTTSIPSFSSADFRKARMKHWLKSDLVLIDPTLSMERDPSPDSAGSSEGQKVWYDYAGKTNNEYAGTQALPLFTALVLPDGTSRYLRTERNNFGFVTKTVETYGTGSSTRTSTFTYAANGQDLVLATNALNVQVVSNSYNSFHNLLSSVNALGETTLLTYNAYQQLTSIKLPSGLITTNLYLASGPNSNHLDRTIDYIAGGSSIYYRSNIYTWSNDLVATFTDARGLITTNTWDNLQRPLTISDSRGTNRYTYSILDLASVTDPLGFRSSYLYDKVRRLVAATNANNAITRLGYCTCGSLSAVTNAFGTPFQQVSTYSYDNQGKRISSIGPDGYYLSYGFDLPGRMTNVSDGVISVTNFFNNQGLITLSSNAFGRAASIIYDPLDRVTNNVSANLVTITNSFDTLDRLVLRGYPDGGVERFGYTLNVAGFTSYTNQITNGVLTLVYDPLGRKTNEQYLGVTTNSFSYGPAGDLLTLKDGKGQVTAWNYDQYGRNTNKLDAASSVILRLGYDPDNRPTNRWTLEKGTTSFAFDAVGNLTNTSYPVSHGIVKQYDVLNRLTNMVDAIGTTTYNYTSAGQLQTEDGPWVDDAISYGYNNRLRTSLNLSAPNASAWTESYGYDSAGRLTSVSSPAGSFSYVYDPLRNLQTGRLNLPNGAVITNKFDVVSRLLSTTLRNSTGALLNSHTYGYDLASQRTWLTNTLGDYRNYLYDNIGELTSARGTETNGTARAHERFGYSYDAAGNLAFRTNTALVQSITFNSFNQIQTWSNSGTLVVAGTTTSPATNVTVSGTALSAASAAIYSSDNSWARGNVSLPNGSATYTASAQDNLGRTDTNSISVLLPNVLTLRYDGNGNLTNDGYRSLSYDDENQLISVVVTNLPTSSTRTDFAYDGLLRRRLRVEETWNGTGWSTNQVVRYVYDGALVVQERDGNNTPVVTYTRGRDLSGGLQRAGGTGGLLARTDMGLFSVIPAFAHAYYQADGNGNITCLINNNQAFVAKYLYDPFGGLIEKEGQIADANLYRFSSQEFHARSGVFGYGFRFYDPTLQRWLNRDPIGERGGLNLYGFVGNNPANSADAYGLAYRYSSTAGNLSELLLQGIPGPLQYVKSEGWQRDRWFDAPLGILNNVVANVGNGVNLVGKTVGDIVKTLGGNEQDGIDAASLFFAGSVLIGGEAAEAGVGAPGLAKSVRCAAAEGGTAALQPMADAAFQTGTIRNVAGYELGGNAGLAGNTYNVNLWGLYSTENSQGPFALINALKGEASAAGASQISITGNAVVNQGLLNISPGVAGRLGLQFQQINPTTILLQGAVH
jgi:RHS repeat-associated protein